jgi:hypothetical protein
MPISTEMIVEVIPTNREMRPPYKSLANRSRPTSSVPRIWASDGGLLNPAARSVVYGSRSAKRGMNTTAKTKIVTIARPSIAFLLWINFFIAWLFRISFMVFFTFPPPSI